MKKSKKLLRKLLKKWQDELTKNQYDDKISGIVDCIEYLIERISNAK